MVPLDGLREVQLTPTYCPVMHLMGNRSLSPDWPIGPLAAGPDEGVAKPPGSILVTTLSRPSFGERVNSSLG